MNREYTTDPSMAPLRLEEEVTYEVRPAREGDTAKVLALGGVAAGLASGLIVLLTEREEKKPPSRAEQARMAIEEAAAKAREQGKNVSTGLSSSLQELSEEASKSTKKARKDAKKRGGKISKQTQKDAEYAMAKIGGFLAAAREEAAGAYHGVEKQAPDVSKIAQELRARTDVAVNEAIRSGSTLRQHARVDTGKAKGELGALAETLKSKAMEAEKVAGSYVESKVLPRLKELEKEAVTAFEVGKEKSQEARKAAQKDLLPQAKESADKLRHTLEDQAKVAAKSLEKGLPEASVKLGAAAGTVEDQAKTAAQAVKRGSRETGSLLMWLGLAGTLVYKVYLNDEQKKKARELGAGLFGEARDMYSDMKGENPNFSA
jgi:gas vesicle protein